MQLRIFAFSTLLLATTIPACSDGSVAHEASTADITSSPKPAQPEEGADSIQSIIAKLADSNDGSWETLPDELRAPGLARVIMKEGAYPGAVFAGILDAEKTSVALWVARYDGSAGVDVARTIGSAPLVDDDAQPLETYAERIPFALVEKDSPPAELAQIPYLVRQADSARVYIRWPRQGGPAALFEIREP